MARLLGCPHCRAEFSFDQWAKASSCPACGARLSFFEASARVAPAFVPASGGSSWDQNPPVLRAIAETHQAIHPSPPTAAPSSAAAPAPAAAAHAASSAAPAPPQAAPAPPQAAPAESSASPAGGWTWSDTAESAPAATATGLSTSPAPATPDAPPVAVFAAATSSPPAAPSVAATPDAPPAASLPAAAPLAAPPVDAPPAATPDAPSAASFPEAAPLVAAAEAAPAAVALSGAALPLVAPAVSVPAGPRRHVYTIGGKALEWSTGWTIVLAVWAIAVVALVAVRVDMGRLTVMSPAERAAIAAVQKAKLPGGASTERVLRWSTTHKLTLEGHVATIPAGGTQMWYAFDRPWEHRIYVYSELPGGSMVGNNAVLSWSVSGGVVKADGSTKVALAKAAQIMAHPPSPHSVPAVPGIIPSLPPDLQ